MSMRVHEVDDHDGRLDEHHPPQQSPLFGIRERPACAAPAHVIIVDQHDHDLVRGRVERREHALRRLGGTRSGRSAQPEGIEPLEVQRLEAVQREEDGHDDQRQHEAHAGAGREIGAELAEGPAQVHGWAVPVRPGSGADSRCGPRARSALGRAAVQG
ncbi:MAG: hypothetical protein U1F11_00225 [Steroidobacteraceae bacterium]